MGDEPRAPAKVAAEQIDEEYYSLYCDPKGERFGHGYIGREKWLADIIREAYAEQTAELAEQISRAEDAEEEATMQAGELERLRAIVDKLRNAKLAQEGWEMSEDVVTLNGKPVGGTITKHRREFDRWWPAVKRELLGAAAEAAGGK